MRRIATLLLCLLALGPTAWRALAAARAPVRACAPEGRGAPPRHWIGCAQDPGPRRDLSGRERVLTGLAVDLNAAGADDLAAVPGLSARLAAEVVADRARRGRFAVVDDLLRVRGVGPTRLARARPFLRTDP